MWLLPCSIVATNISAPMPTLIIPAAVSRSKGSILSEQWKKSKKVQLFRSEKIDQRFPFWFLKWKYLR